MATGKISIVRATSLQSNIVICQNNFWKPCSWKTNKKYCMSVDGELDGAAS